MTDLTEQWKKGKLPEAWYYVKDIHNKESLDRYFKETDNFEYLEDWEVAEVLAPVPSYEEWQASEKYNKHLEEVIKIYERKDKQATETSIAYNKLAEENEELKLLVAELKEKIVKMKDVVLDTETNNMKSIIEIVNVAKENTQLKELLKECQNMIAFKHEVYEEDALIKEIDEVLK